MMSKDSTDFANLVLDLIHVGMYYSDLNKGRVNYVFGMPALDFFMLPPQRGQRY